MFVGGEYSALDPGAAIVQNKESATETLGPLSAEQDADSRPPCTGIIAQGIITAWYSVHQDSILAVFNIDRAQFACSIHIYFRYAATLHRYQVSRQRLFRIRNNMQKRPENSKRKRRNS
jgi:hypothetical protein